MIAGNAEIPVANVQHTWKALGDPLDNRVLSEKLNAKILDLHSDGCTRHWQQYKFEDSSLFESKLKDNTNLKMRIVSFHCPLTCSPIEASRKDLEALCSIYSIDVAFRDTLSAFGRFPDPANGYDTVPSVSMTESLSFECWYRLQYPERNNRSVGTSWSIRHTGIYHQYRNTDGFALVVLIHPYRDSILESTLFGNDSESSNAIREELASNPVNIHMLLCDNYLPNWSPCIRDQSKTQAEINDDVQTSNLSTGSLDSDFLLTQKLRFLKDATVTNHVLCQDNLSVLDELFKIFKNFKPRNDYIKTNKAKVEARCNSLLLLQGRIQNDIELLQHAATQRDSKINHHNQALATRLNETLLNLTYNTVDDSATIKIITVLSLIFLPGSFVAAIFGTNFFVFDDNGTDPGPSSPGLVVGHNFWLFISVWLPVTALVLVVYLFVIWRRQRLVKQRRRPVFQLKGDDAV